MLHDSYMNCYSICVCPYVLSLLDVHYYQRNSHPPFLPQTQSSQSSVDRGRGLLELPRPFREKVLQTNAFPRIGFGPSLIRSLAGFVQSRRGAEDR